MDFPRILKQFCHRIDCFLTGQQVNNLPLYVP